MKVAWGLGEFLFVMTITLCCGFVIGGYTLEKVERCRMMDRAVAEGHARFYLDEKNVRCWEWLPACRKGE